MSDFPPPPSPSCTIFLLILYSMFKPIPTYHPSRKYTLTRPTRVYINLLSPHTLPPQQLYLAHLAPYLAATETQLLSSLSTTQAENSELALLIHSQWEQAERLLSGFEKVISDLEAANEIMEESADLLGKTRRNEFNEDMEVTEEVGDGGEGSGPRS